MGKLKLLLNQLLSRQENESFAQEAPLLLDVLEFLTHPLLIAFPSLI
jgi:hypothetical protein